jgi:uncharacterized protein
MKILGDGILLHLLIPKVNSMCRFLLVNQTKKSYLNQTKISDYNIKKWFMSEIINNSRVRVDQIKELILDLHKGRSLEETRARLSQLMASVPYGEVVQAEEELINEGLPAEEVLKHCDLHSDALKGNIDVSGVKPVPEAHPVDTFRQENKALNAVTDRLKHLYHKFKEKRAPAGSEIIYEIRSIFNELTDIEKHYLRKENLLFSFLEKHGVTGPPVVMWGKDNEVREFLRSALELLKEIKDVTEEELEGYFELVFNPAAKSIDEMIYKEENILFPMSLDVLSEQDWYEIYLQSDEIGYCLVSPSAEWIPEGSMAADEKNTLSNGRIQLSTGSFTTEELEGIFNSIPYDLTFVDKDDNVRFFSHGEERIFQRNKAILGRKVHNCHPPQSVHIVEKIVNDFRSGAQDSAKFWINFKGMYVHIAYYAVRDKKGEYLGTLELTQDIAPLQKIEGERRLLTYDKE